MERMHFGPDPQWPINIITTPKNLRFDAALEITVKDDLGKPLSGVNFTLKNLKTGKTIKLGKTNAKGIIIKEKLPYGKYQLVQTAVKGYKNSKLTQNIELTTKDNSYNKISIVNTKIKPVTSSKTEYVQSKNSSSSKVTSSDKTSSKDTTSKENVTSQNTTSQKTPSKNSDTSSEKIGSGSDTASQIPEKYAK